MIKTMTLSCSLKQNNHTYLNVLIIFFIVPWDLQWIMWTLKCQVEEHWWSSLCWLSDDLLCSLSKQVSAVPPLGLPCHFFIVPKVIPHHIILLLFVMITPLFKYRDIEIQTTKLPCVLIVVLTAHPVAIEWAETPPECWDWRRIWWQMSGGDLVGR